MLHSNYTDLGCAVLHFRFSAWRVYLKQIFVFQGEISLPFVTVRPPLCLPALMLQSNSLDWLKHSDTPGLGLPAFLPCFLDTLQSKKALQDLSEEMEQAWRAPASHSPTTLQALIYSYSKEIFHDLTTNRKYASAGGCCSPALATLATLLLAPEWKKGRPLGPDVPSDAMHGRRLRVSKKAGRSWSRLPVPNCRLPRLGATGGS